MYDATTIAITSAIASVIGRTRPAEVADAASRTTSAASVAYATEESGSEAKIGRASFWRERLCSSAVGRGGPRTARLSATAPSRVLMAARRPEARRGSRRSRHRALARTGRSRRAARGRRGDSEAARHHSIEIDRVVLQGGPQFRGTDLSGERRQVDDARRESMLALLLGLRTDGPGQAPAFAGGPAVPYLPCKREHDPTLGRAAQRRVTIPAGRLRKLAAPLAGNRRPAR